MQAAVWAQTILYSIFIRAGDPKPQPGSVRFVKHRRQILIAIYAAYFAFTIYEVDFNLQRSSNAYNDLGVPINVDETSPEPPRPPWILNFVIAPIYHHKPSQDSDHPVQILLKADVYICYP